MNKRKVGVFDSGVGGLSVANAIQDALPDVAVQYAHDREHVPYGDKTPEQLLEYVVPILERLVADGCICIVIACNTVTTTSIDQLRKQIAVPLIGMEPMVKPAAQQTKTGVIAVCATPATLASARYKWLKQTYATAIAVLEPDCSRWSYMIEHDAVEDEYISRQIDEICNANADVIVLGCTHYHWIEEKIRAMTNGRALVIQPEPAVIRQLQRVLERS